jgi:hypothetical protein
MRHIDASVSSLDNILIAHRYPKGHARAASKTDVRHALSTRMFMATVLTKV